MDSIYINENLIIEEEYIESESLESELDSTPTNNHPMRFDCHFEDAMIMKGNSETVMRYFDQHQGWFCRCAHPMKADPLGDNGYVLTIGKYGAFGYSVEPKVGLELLPQDQGIYRIQSTMVPDYVPPGYDVDFQSSMFLEEESTCDGVITIVKWVLDLSVYIYFPRFITRLSKSLLQRTGDKVLLQIVRQVNSRLTTKIKEDFHRVTMM